ncbi:MAG: lipoyl(octanoyl) transferase LipB [Deltaproteobacteria bacterium]|nr:lipoyl(octanoyl) transferase LipB [Deltaproteobacteria bacterium]
MGRADYRRVLSDQLALRERVWSGTDVGAVLLCEHPPTITLGRSATEANILDPGDLPIIRIERGGEVTYHGPGQLMVYAIVRIRSVVEFLECVASTLVAACAAVGVPAEWRRTPAGVWHGDAKLAACGIHVARGVPIHGFALDVATPPAAWRRIRPCGLSTPTVSLAAARGDHAITVERMAIEVGPRLAAALSVR